MQASQGSPRLLPRWQPIGHDPRLVACHNTCLRPPSTCSGQRWSDMNVLNNERLKKWRYIFWETCGGACSVTVLTIRTHKRFGVCKSVRVHLACGTSVDGLLIEVSLEGLRVSNLTACDLDVEELVRVEIEGWQDFSARVRWRSHRIVGVRLEPPLHSRELANLLDFCRSSPLNEAKRA